MSEGEEHQYGEPDLEQEGLLEGVEGAAREARIKLLRRLLSGGASLEELKQAVEEDRLALLPAERTLGQPTPYTIDDLAERTGVDPQFFLALFRAAGLAAPEEEFAYSQARTEGGSRG